MANRAVPKTSQVTPGAHVNIVLKPDQRTGRQVSGVVRDVLTRGDHHRGIKVRLTDGRIGRVQSIADASSPTNSGSTTAVQGGVASPADGLVDPVSNATSRPRGRSPRYRDARLEEPLEAAPQQADLSAFIVPARRQGKGKKGQRGQKGQRGETSRSRSPANHHRTPLGNEVDAAADVGSVITTCPVCGTFEGDETAVSYHVAEHFQ
ncbi:hypothetical protein GGS23DRAFT_611121 [Durotheca rogersii]|uniref:uncharacterized protein n=1 Tax=Durotheca rogersii TaxID=419775 RepID=UPI00221EDAD8|nr:uncharacterized protein GGS23DRAFT_611121 [Durotheca rogersii]KAI5861948.1 hypothetical protein GGS23DRAFT_611121 [Durotheca rogersii]